MTALEKINDLNQEIYITSKMLARIYYNASVAGLEVGDTVTYLDLLYATILPSGADAAQVLAYTLSDSIDEFINDMNLLAKRIGMVNSNFKTTSGLDKEGQFSTVNDTLILLKYAFKNDTFRKIFTTKTYTLSNKLVVKSTLFHYAKNYDYNISRILGSKTGRTKKAGTCLASYFIVNNEQILIITAGAPYNQIPYNLDDTLKLISYLDDNYIPVLESPIIESNDNEEIGNLGTSDVKQEQFSEIKIGILLVIGLFSLILFKVSKKY